MENLLLVEGPADIHVISRLLEKRDLTKLRDENDKSARPLKLFLCARPLDIMHVADKGNVVSNFETTLKFANQPHYKTVGLVLDFDAPNETQANNRDVAMRDAILRLQKSGFRWRLPDDFTVLSDTNEGFIAEPANEDTPRIGVWLMPDNHNRGMLETFLQRLIPEERSKLLEHARHSTDKAKDEYAAPFKPVHREKAVVHTFLAWMDEPGYPFGTSFRNGSFDAKSALANKFVEWMQKLFRD